MSSSKSSKGFDVVESMVSYGESISKGFEVIKEEEEKKENEDEEEERNV